MARLIPFHQLAPVPVGDDPVAQSLQTIHGILKGVATMVDSRAGERQSDNLQRAHLELANAFSACKVACLATPSAAMDDARTLIPASVPA